MRCDECGTVWFSAVADKVVAWGQCVKCGGGLHLERRDQDRRVMAHAA
jgi:hypothetical protein